MAEHHEEFADPVVVPGPNLRSRFTDTEDLREPAVELVDDEQARFCSRCHRVFPATTSRCPDDDTTLVLLPPARSG